MYIIKIPGIGNCITVREAREFLNVSRQAVHQAIGLGRIRAKALPGALGSFVSLADVERYKAEFSTKKA